MPWPVIRSSPCSSVVITAAAAATSSAPLTPSTTFPSTSTPASTQRAPRLAPAPAAGTTTRRGAARARPGPTARARTAAVAGLPRQRAVPARLRPRSRRSLPAAFQGIGIGALSELSREISPDSLVSTTTCNNTLLRQDTSTLARPSGQLLPHIHLHWRHPPTSLRF